MTNENEKMAFIKEQMPVTRDLVYLNTGTAGPLSQVTLDALREGARADFDQGRGTFSSFMPFFEALVAAREAMARLVNATPAEIAITHNTTEGINIVVHGMTWQPGDEIITTNWEHEGGLLPLYVLKQRYGVVLKVVELSMADGPQQILEKLASQLGPRTRLLLFSHVAWNNGLRFPLEEIVSLAHRHHALTLVDAAQSVGAIPLDLPASGVDFYAMPGQKWLCGPEGTGALYVSRTALAHLAPTFVGFFSLRDFTAYDFSGHFIPGAGASRFEVSSVYRPGIRAMAANLDWLEQTVGWDWIHGHIGRIFAYAYQQLQAIPKIDLITQPGPQAGLISFNLEGYEPERVMARLEEANIVVRTIGHPHCLRISTGFYTSEADIDSLVAVLAEIVANDPEDLPVFVSPFG